MRLNPIIRVGFLHLALFGTSTSGLSGNLNMLVEPPFSLVRMAPDGGHVVAFERSPDGLQNTLLIDAKDLKSSSIPVSDGKGGKARITDLRWLDSETLIILSKGGEDDDWLSTFRLGDKSPNRLAQEGKRSIQSVIPGTSRFLVVENRSSRIVNRWKLLEYDAKSEAEPKLIYESDSKTFECVTDRKGRLRLVKKQRESHTDLAWFRIEPDGSEAELSALGHWIKVHGIVQSSNHAIASGSIVAPNPTIHVFDIAKDKALQILADQPEYSVDVHGNTAFDPATGAVVGLYLDTITRETFWTDQQLAQIQAKIDERLAGSTNRIVAWSDDRTRLLVERFIPMLPTQFLHVDLGSDRYAAILSNGGRVKPEDVGATRIVDIPNRDGHTMSVLLTAPAEKSEGKSPLLIWVRPGIWSDLERAEWSPEANYFASEGFLVLRINYSGSEGLLGPLSTDTGTKQGVLRTFRDIEDAAKALVDAGLIDPARICIAGEAEGAWAAAYAPIASPGLYKAVLCFNGVYDLVAYHAGSSGANPMGGGQTFRFASRWQENSQEQAEFFSVTQNLENYPKDVFVAYGKWSDNAHKDQALEFVKALKKAKSSPKVFADDWWGAQLSGTKRLEAFAKAGALARSAVK